MNKQEAIEKLTNIANGTGWVTCTSACNIISQIHEPQTVVVPKFVAEWIEKKTKSLGWSFKVALNNPIDSVYGWLANRNNQETFARAWLDGYEIEREKLYTVEIPDPNCLDVVTFLCKENGKVFIGGDIFWDELPNYNWKKEPENQLTESEIKQDFEWA
ncbi:DUF1642 domain-containing protein [Streptococcus suis]|uniref:Phage protein n=1 Tax=Streptococcus suis TaxID=1307 RepID=A0A0Z8CM17_STRSU|nr:DUF1642 domain-containing protein [Streptococcus suis]NQH93779.1 DUF1642 domain-containing protein [Streptococcus suis]CYU27576.1 phage protein [Streptococcus suis]CYU40717.1 phage protein [Streptococcus suis]